MSSAGEKTEGTGGAYDSPEDSQVVGTGTGGDITVTREMGVELASDRVGVEAVDKDRVD